MKVIELNEDCGIKKIRDLHEEAKRATDKGPDCVFDLSNVRRIDLSVVQIILAMQQECERKGGRCEIRNSDEPTSRLLACAGIK